MCSLPPDSGPGISSQKQIQEVLEKGTVEAKIQAMQDVIRAHLAYQSYPELLMVIIRFVVPVPDHKLKKLVLYYFELIDKADANGRLLDPMLLVINFLRADLQHANEYVRGCTLRFMTKVKEHDLLEPLVEPIVANLENRHAYVRRNALLAVTAIYRRYPQLLPDAADAVEAFLKTENDVSALRNAFTFLVHHARPRTSAFVRRLADAPDIRAEIPGDAYQLAILQALPTLCGDDPSSMAAYLRVLFGILQTDSATVLFQGASALLELGANNATCVRAAARTYVQLLSSQGAGADHNVKLVLLSRLEGIRAAGHTDVLADLTLDLLRVLSDPSTDIKLKVLDIVVSVATPRVADGAIARLKKELAASRGAETAACQQAAAAAASSASGTGGGSGGSGGSGEEGKSNGVTDYRRQLIRTMHHCAKLVPALYPSVLPALAPILSETGTATMDAVTVLRDAARSAATRLAVLDVVGDALSAVTCGRVARALLWVGGTNCNHSHEVRKMLAAIHTALGPLPIAPPEIPEDSAETLEEATRRVALEHPLRGLLLGGDLFLAEGVAAALVKLALRHAACTTPTEEAKDALVNDACGAIGHLVAFIKSRPEATLADGDVIERLHVLRALLECRDLALVRELIPDTLAAFDAMKSAADAAVAAEAEDDRRAAGDERRAAGAGAGGSGSGSAGLAKKGSSVVDPVAFPQLSAAGARARAAPSAAAAKIMHDPSSTFAFGREVAELASVVTDQRAAGAEILSSRALSHVRQLTGLCETIYAEVTVTVHQFDLSLSFLLANTTASTLQNVTLELATVGETLRICERVPSFTLAPHEVVTPTVNVRVAATEAGVIYGFITYEMDKQQHSLNLVDAHIDVVEFISPATVSPVTFRSYWAEFEWENKIGVRTNITSLVEYLENVVRNTNLRCLTPLDQLADADFLSANLYGRSRFGEDAVANVSIERTPAGVIEGFVRIRAKTQGVALSLVRFGVVVCGFLSLIASLMAPHLDYPIPSATPQGDQVTLTQKYSSNQQRNVDTATA